MPGPRKAAGPGSSLALMQSQHLDGNSIEFGILGPLGATGQGDFNLDFSAAMCSAVNDWQRETFTRPEKRLKGGIVVPYEDAAASVAEIDRCGRRSRLRPGVRADALVRADRAAAATGRSTRPLKRYEPAGRRPRLRHQRASGVGRRLAELLRRGRRGPFDVVPDGGVTSLVIEGVFERFPKPQGGDGGGRLRLAAAADVAARQAVRAHARRGAAPEAQAVRVHPRARLRDDAADGGAGRSPACAGRHGVDRLGPAAVRQRLSALGFRRPVPRLSGRPERRSGTAQICAENGRSVYRLQ